MSHEGPAVGATILSDAVCKSKRRRPYRRAAVALEPLDLRLNIDRATADRLLSMAEFLPPAERGLVLSIYRDRLRLGTVASISGRPSRIVARELKRCTRRALGPAFGFIVAERARATPIDSRTRLADGGLEWPETWPERLRDVAMLCVLHGLSRRQAADRMGVTLHAVRRQLDLLRGMMRMRPAAASSSSPHRVKSDRKFGVAA